MDRILQGKVDEGCLIPSSFSYVGGLQKQEPNQQHQLRSQRKFTSGRRPLKDSFEKSQGGKSTRVSTLNGV